MLQPAGQAAAYGSLLNGWCCGALRPRYFWDLATGKRHTEAEYVDKRALYAGAVFSGLEGRTSAVVRASDGRLQHVYQGHVEYEVAGPRCTDRACLALLGGDRVLLTSNEKGAAREVHGGGGRGVGAGCQGRLVKASKGGLLRGCWLRTRYCCAGGLLSYPWPSTFPAPPGMARFSEPQTYHLHAPRAGGVAYMVAQPDTGLLFTARCARWHPGTRALRPECRRHP